MPGEMRLTFYVALIGMALLFVTLWKYEMTSKQASAQLRALRRKLAGEDPPLAVERSAAPRVTVEA
jgi:heme exporter protein C